MLGDLVRRPLAALAATRAGARVYRAVLPPLDAAVRRSTGGKRTFTALLLPTLVLVSTGRRSGLERRQPLIHQPVADGWAVVGSNWGQEHHPAWTHNLLAEPSARVEVDGQVHEVRARLAEGAEREAIYGRFERLSPNYREYRDWSGDREIRVFVLERT